MPFFAKKSLLFLSAFVLLEHTVAASFAQVPAFDVVEAWKNKPTVLQNTEPRSLREQLQELLKSDPKATKTYAALTLQPWDTQAAPLEVAHSILWSMGAQYPDLKRPGIWIARPQIGKDLPIGNPETLDWMEALVSLTEANWVVGWNETHPSETMKKKLPISEADRTLFVTTRAHLLFRVALLRLLGQAGKQGDFAAANPVFTAAFLHEGILRDECGRTLRTMKSYALPYLVRVARGPAQKAVKDFAAHRRYANHQLERLGVQSPKKALNAASPEVQIELLQTFGDIQDNTAVEYVLAYTADKSPPVRDKARWAWLRYVEGPPPKEPPKRKRKLPGGKEEKEAKEDYFTFLQRANIEIRNTLASLGQPIPKKSTLKQLTLQLFAYYDQQQQSKDNQTFQQGAKALQAGQVETATKIFDEILLSNPMSVHAADMAPAFASQGMQLGKEALRQKDPSLQNKALVLLHKALLLAPASPNAACIQAQIYALYAQMPHALANAAEKASAFAQQCNQPSSN